MNYLEELIREAMAEKSPTAVTHPSPEAIHAAAVEMVRVKKFGVSDLRSAIFELIYRAPRKRLQIRPLSGLIDRSFGHVVSIEKDIDKRNDFKQLFRDNVFHDTVQYQATGGQFEFHYLIVQEIDKYLARYKHRIRFLEKDANPFSADFPKSFWQKENLDEPIYYGDSPADTRYSEADLAEWSNGHYQRSDTLVEKEVKKAPPPPTAQVKEQVEKIITAAKAEVIIPEPEEVKISKHQEEKNARKKKEEEFAILCFNALRYNDSSASQCLVEAIWYNANRGQQYIVQEAMKKSGAGKDFILALLEQYYLERYLTVSEHGPVIDKEIAGAVKGLLRSGVGANGVRLIRNPAT